MKKAAEAMEKRNEKRDTFTFKAELLSTTFKPFLPHI